MLMKKVYVKVNSLKELQNRMKQWCQSLDFIEFNISNETFETHYKVQEISYDDVIVLLDKNNQSYYWVKWNGKKLEERL